eukprot:Hpha_TRINITY_DN34731_c0_g1::TRINITY_DN34731_c0_g1_i1::g.177959::m.177959
MAWRDQEEGQEQETLLPPGRQAHVPRGMRVTHREAADDSRLMAEREQRIEGMEEDVVDVLRLLQQTDGLVARQGEALDVLTDNVEGGAGNVRAARAEIRKAELRAQRSRRRRCWVAMCLATAAIILALWTTHTI